MSISDLKEYKTKSDLVRNQINLITEKIRDKEMLMIKIAKKLDMSPNVLSVTVSRMRNEPRWGSRTVEILHKLSKIVGVKCDLEYQSLPGKIDKDYKNYLKAVQIMIIKDNISCSDISKKMEISKEYVCSHVYRQRRSTSKGSKGKSYVSSLEKEKFISLCKKIKVKV